MSKITLKQHIAFVVWHLIAAFGFICIGFILMSTFLYTEEEFWSNVARFYR